jgi:hypothetical protein
LGTGCAVIDRAYSLVPGVSKNHTIHNFQNYLKVQNTWARLKS